jgi:acyl dehydratase
VEVVGAPVSPTTSPNRLVVQPSGQVLDVRRIAVRDLDAHVYGECSRIWNPIHTDPAVARAANLPGTVLHGTLTLAHGVSATMDMLEAGPEDVRRVGGAFRGMVRTPGELRVRLLHVTGDRHHGVASFDVATADDVIAVRDGFVLFGSSGQR